jgi:PAS domain S-box-containing protein
MSYEVSMSIGVSLDVEEMLRGTLKTIMRKLNCWGAAVLEMVPLDPVGLVRIIFAMPADLASDTAFKQIFEKIREGIECLGVEVFSGTLPRRWTLPDECFIHCFAMGKGTALMLCRSGEPLEEPVARAIVPLAGKLGGAFNACMEHAALEVIAEEGRILREISLKGIETKSFPQFQQYVLALLGEKLGVSRSYIFEHFPGEEVYSNTAEWTAPGVVPQKDSLQGIPTAEVAWWHDTMTGGGDIRFADIEDIPDENAKEILRTQGIKSIMVVPLFLGTRYYGFAGFDDCDSNREWTQRERRLLADAARILVGAWADSELRLTEKMYRELADSLPQVVFELDNYGFLTFVNANVFETLLYTRDDLARGFHFTKAIDEPERERMEDAFAEIVGGGFAGAPLESAALRADGSTFPCLVYAAPMRDESREVIGVRGILADVTNLKELEEALMRANATLKDLVVVAAHELRHPATVFRGYANILLASWDELDADTIRDALSAIDRATDRLTSLVVNLLDASVIESGELVLSLSESDPRAPVRRAVEEARSRGTGNEFRVSLEDMGTAQIDVDRLRHVLSILLENAVKFSPEGSPVDISCIADEACIIYRVADHGIGISEEEKEKVFERFYQAVGVNHHSLHGIGLGLYMARTIVEAHGGWIRVEPRENGGSVFSFGIPNTRSSG